MRKNRITVTEAARNFSDCVSRARYQNATFVLVKNGEPVAQIAPVKEKVCTAGELAKLLATVRLTEDEARAWRRDLKAARRVLKAPVDKWR